MINLFPSRLIILLSAVSIFWIGCDDNSTDSQANDQFDRTLMLRHWADGFVIPGYQAYLEALEEMDSQANNFVADPTLSTLNTLRNTYKTAYKAWQEVSMFEIGKAEELALRNQTNIYPTNTIDIIENISSGNYNLALPSTIDQQGFPAIDYMIHFSDDEAIIVNKYIEDTNYKTYLIDLTSRLKKLTQEVYIDWTTGYRETFIADDGSSASSSVNRMVNDYLFYFEWNLRKAKIGDPSGVFTGTVLPSHVEAVYTSSPAISKSLYFTALTSVQKFFNGDSKYIGEGPSLADYLDYIKSLTDGQDIRSAIDSGFQNCIQVSSELDDNLQQQIIDDNSKMVTTFDALKTFTIRLKTDMLSALNISVDYVDADGD